MRVAEDETEEERERWGESHSQRRERERKKEGAGMKKKMGYAPFALRYTAQWKSIRMVIKERQRC